jgi:hypothetical protein
MTRERDHVIGLSGCDGCVGLRKAVFDVHVLDHQVQFTLLIRRHQTEFVGLRVESLRALAGLDLFAKVAGGQIA